MPLFNALNGIHSDTELDTEPSKLVNIFLEADVNGELNGTSGKSPERVLQEMGLTLDIHRLITMGSLLYIF